jgi:hypothetical protein
MSISYEFMGNENVFHMNQKGAENGFQDIAKTSGTKTLTDNNPDKLSGKQHFS